ncbi:MAG: heparinase II/III family protein [Devosia sp.]|uniref:heparinase II/III family protein n=1 Tax=Devosia sp. TaxID=1871048 RepID=UPI001AD3CDA5|nr:heparinase II/III family protein [Devosia sp.]MBN9316598.1 heparinase II/III family protein [Devosia sp.]
MANPLRFLARRTLLSAADHLVTNPLVRWTWTGPSSEEMIGALGEFRPTDRETVLEMMQGRYLLASKLVDTHGVSPFSLEVDHDDWQDDLQAFNWLRHFRDARTDEERRFARTLTLDWIGRDGHFNRDTWGPSLTARRVLNWLRHYNILLEGATPDQAQQVSRSLSTQISSLKLRGGLATDPVDALLVAIALVGVALCADRPQVEVEARVRRVLHHIDHQVDDDGLHRTRSAKTQVQLLVELVTIKQAMRRDHEQLSAELDEITDSMHRALDAISLGTGEPAYFNGTGQMPHDLIVAVQAQSPARARETGVVGGYGRLISGRSIVVADSGLVPDPAFTRHAHASALAFEFSHGRDLVVCNCGPAPSDYEDGLLFRQGIAHSAPTINALSAAAIPTSGPLAGRLVQLGRPSEIEARSADDTVVISAHGYAERFGVTLERHLTLLAEGKTLVGQDRFVRQRGRVSGAASIRFHLAHQTEVQVTDDLVRLRLGSGAVWTFLWEGAEMRVEDSVRQSAYFGFHRTRQLVLEVLVADASEVSWIFTLEED